MLKVAHKMDVSFTSILHAQQHFSMFGEVAKGKKSKPAYHMVDNDVVHLVHA
jgi:hypothetical protein